jgi:hypothetical protein
METHAFVQNRDNADIRMRTPQLAREAAAGFKIQKDAETRTSASLPEI